MDNPDTRATLGIRHRTKTKKNTTQETRKMIQTDRSKVQLFHAVLSCFVYFQIYRNFEFVPCGDLGVNIQYVQILIFILKQNKVHPGIIQPNQNESHQIGKASHMLNLYYLYLTNIIYRQTFVSYKLYIDKHLSAINYIQTNICQL